MCNRTAKSRGINGAREVLEKVKSELSSVRGKEQVRPGFGEESSLSPSGRGSPQEILDPCNLGLRFTVWAPGPYEGKALRPTLCLLL